MKREPCGLPEPEDRCACERRGCCWGADDPFASGIPGVAKCYFLYGGPGQVPYQEWSIRVGENATLTLNGVASGARIIVVAEDGVCGQAPPSLDARVAVPQGQDYPVVFSKVGTYRVCVLDDEQCLPDPVACDAPRFYTKRGGVVHAYENLEDILGDEVEGCPHKPWAGNETEAA